MFTVNSISGGQSSAYLMARYPAALNLFALIEIADPAAAPKDPFIKRYFESKTGREFIATAEDDVIAYTLYDLEQHTGQEITFVKNPSFDEVIKKKKIVPSMFRRFCTAEMKVEPIANYILENCPQPVEVRLGFRANEVKRAERKRNSANADGYEEIRRVVGKLPDGRNKWATVPYAKYAFPLMEDGIFKDTIVQFWADKPVRFAERNNCIGCFHRNPLLLNLMAQKFPEKYAWFEAQEGKSKRVDKEGVERVLNTWKEEGTYKEFRQHKTQLRLTDLPGFTDCDTGYCGL